MKDLDTNTIIKKVLGWGFLATLAIGGLALSIFGGLYAKHNPNIFIIGGIIISALAAILYTIQMILSNKVLELTQELKAAKIEVEKLKAEVDELKTKIDNLQTTLIQVTEQKNFLEAELQRKQTKIDKLTKKGGQE